MKNEFMTDEEYKNCFVDFWGIRTKIVNLLSAYRLQAGVRVLDVPAGHGFLSYEVAKVIHQGVIHAIGLQNDLETYQKFFHSPKSKADQNFLKLITYHVMDATQLDFPSETVDFVVNFLGLEDINMTRGVEGVKKSLAEFVRVLKPKGIVQLTLCLEGDEPDQVIAQQVMDFIGFNAIFHPKEFYIRELENLGVEILAKNWFYTQRKMTATQAKEELEFACTETAKIFQDYNVRTISFEELWDKFGKQIEIHGMAYYSNLCVLIGQKR
ncbi:MAG: class I SAM-dependent methyltransferase [Candidatus Hodarchaeota archaeon]